MPTPLELEQKFWKSLKSDRTAMLGLVDSHDHYRPMTAQLDGDADDYKGDIWFFSSKDTSLVSELNQGNKAMVNFSSKGHDLFSCVEGTLSLSNDRAVIDRLWNPFVAAWYEGGKDDPKLALLQFKPEHAQIWLDGSSLIAGIKVLFGADPKEEYKDNVAKVRLG